MIEFNLIGYM